MFLFDLLILKADLWNLKQSELSTRSVHGCECECESGGHKGGKYDSINNVTI